MDAEETVDWIEWCSAAVAEWNSRKMGKKNCLETDRTRDLQARRILDLKNEDKGESPLLANLDPSHNTRYTKTKERPVGIQQTTNAKMTHDKHDEGAALVNNRGSARQEEDTKHQISCYRV